MPPPDEILQFSSPLEFQSRPNYRDRLAATKEELERIVGKYMLPAPKASWISCGLNDCDEPHRRGYLIRLYDGRETHCGNACGRKHFGVMWEEVEATAKAVETATATRNAVASLLERRDALIARATALIEPSEVLERRVFALRDELHKHSALWRQVETCAKLDGSVRISVDPPPGAGGYAKSRGVSLKTIARIDGARLLLPEFLRYSNVITKNVLPSLARLEPGLLNGATVKELATHSKDGAALSTSLDRADHQISEGRKLFEASNLRKFELIVEHQLASRDITPQMRSSLDKAYSL